MYVGNSPPPGSTLLQMVAPAPGIQKWITPSGQMYFGDNPPPGSTLVERIADTVDIIGPPSSALAQDAAEGRELIRRQEAEREAQLDREALERREALRHHEPEARPHFDGGQIIIVKSSIIPFRHANFSRKHPDDCLESRTPSSVSCADVHAPPTHPHAHPQPRVGSRTETFGSKTATKHRRNAA
jgi:hypothetical protein